MPFNLILIGIISILGQVVILRELSVALFGIELIYILSIGIWLFWTGVGALIASKSFQPTRTAVNLLFLTLAFILPLDVVFIRGLHIVFGGVSGMYLPFHYQFLGIVLALLPLCLILGLLFQWAARLYICRGRILARAYAIECIGGIVGGLAATILLKLGIQNLNIAIICSLAALSACLIYSGRRYVTPIRLSAVVVIFLLVTAASKIRIIDYWMTRWTHPSLVETRDTPYGRVTVRSLHGQLAVFENDALNFETEGTAAEEFANLSALQVITPMRILLLGGGMEGTVHELLKHRPEKIDYIELNGLMLDMVRKYLPEKIHLSLNAENVNITIADPRRFLRTAATYDLIMVGMPEPMSGQTNRFYTRDFFSDCASRLEKDGVLTFRLRGAENLWTPQLISRNASIYGALKAVFPHVVILPGATNIIIASHDSLSIDPDIYADRLNARHVSTRLVTPKYIHYLYTNDRFQKIRNILERENTSLNSDNQPVCYQYTLMIWLSKFYNKLAFKKVSLGGDTGWQRIVISVAILVLFLVTAFMFRRRQPARRALLVGMAGLVGMVAETVLILHYQTKCGVLYQDIGLLLMSFMAGLTIGAYYAGRIMLPVPKSGQPSSAKDSRIIKRLGLSLIAGFCLLNVVTGLAFTLNVVTSLAGIAALMILTGMFVAGIFAYVSIDRVTDQSSVVAPLYAADLVGGCIGSLAGVLILIPMLGLTFTSFFMGALTILCLILL